MSLIFRLELATSFYLFGRGSVWPTVAGLKVLMLAVFLWWGRGGGGGGRLGLGFVWARDVVENHDAGACDKGSYSG